MKASTLNLFKCNPSFGTEKCVFNQNLKTLIFTFAPPLEQCAGIEYDCYYLDSSLVLNPWIEIPNATSDHHDHSQ